MSDPVLALILIASFFLVITAASYFKTLERGLWLEARVPIVAGVIAGIAMRFVPEWHVVAAGVLMTLAALYVRLTGRESEPSDGMVLGAMTGAAASLPFVVMNDAAPLLRFTECILAGAVAGYGITFGLTHVREKLRQLAVDAITAALAIGAAALPSFAIKARMPERELAIIAAALVPLLLIATVFKQWPIVRAELRHEAVLGVIDEEDVRSTAHPFRRLGRGGWHDAGAHREFVRIANKIALRKRQQRNRPDEIARLYQLEVIKLRMELQAMTQIDRAMRLQSET
ncbi:MAG TPA: hypothetical protein VF787_16585 [Thermoanaerobaculia bacterium]